MDKQDSSFQAKTRSMDEETQKNVFNSVIVFYKVKSISSDPTQNVFLEKDRIGYGFVATSDGWVIADKIISAFGIKQIAAVIKGGKIATVIKIEKDLKNGLVFARLDASGLKPISFGDPRDLMPGENLYLFGGPQKITRIYFGGIGYEPAVSAQSVINSSESFGKVLFFGEAVNSDFNGLPIVNYRGDAVGVVAGDGKTVATGIPFGYVQKSLQSLFKYSKIKQPFLGLKYLDLSHSASIDEKWEKNGAMILSAEDKASGLMKGDVVLKINNEELNKEYNLSEILSEYKVGDELNFSVLRGGKEQVLKVRVGE